MKDSTAHALADDAAALTTQRLDAHTAELAATQAAHDAAVEERDAAHAAFAAAVRRLGDARAEVARLDERGERGDRLDAAHMTVAAARAEIDQQRDREAQAERRIGELNDALHALQTAAPPTVTPDDLRAQERTIAGLAERVDALSARKSEHEATLDGLAHARQRLAAVETAALDAAAAAAMGETPDRSADEIEVERAQLADEVAALERAAPLARATCRRIDDQIATVQARIETERENVERMRLACAVTLRDAAAKAANEAADVLRDRLARFLAADQAVVSMGGASRRGHRWSQLEVPRIGGDAGDGITAGRVEALADGYAADIREALHGDGMGDGMGDA